MFRTLNRWGHYLPGLRLAEPGAYIMLGVIGLLACAVIIVFSRKPRTWLVTAFGGTAMWTWFCGITIFDQWWSAEFVGRWSNDRLQLAQQTVPAYWIVGCLFIWIIYVARRMWRSRARTVAGGFPVIMEEKGKK